MLPAVRQTYTCEEAMITFIHFVQTHAVQMLGVAVLLALCLLTSDEDVVEA